jgi:3D-(3,5/4)-trihydroxycyclohexane-1,2-dione acylhydrolase (decyclizing)
MPLVCDAFVGLRALSELLGNWKSPTAWVKLAKAGRTEWNKTANSVIAQPKGNRPASDAEVIGAVARTGGKDRVVVCAAGGLPGELHKLWRAGEPGSYHLEYGFSCMGYEIAGGLGVKLARPDADVVVVVGDGSYLMMNSEIATAVMMGKKLTIVVLDNRGFGCINRLQMATGNANFNNLLEHSLHQSLLRIDFAAHAASLGATAEKAGSIRELEDALHRAKAAKETRVVVIDTDPLISTGHGGHWWDVAVPEVSPRAAVRAARKAYEKAMAAQRLGD